MRRLKRICKEMNEPFGDKRTDLFLLLLGALLGAGVVDDGLLRAFLPENAAPALVAAHGVAGAQVHRHCAASALVFHFVVE